MKSKVVQVQHILPGYSFQLPRTDFRKKVYHKFKNGIPIIEKAYLPMSSDELESAPKKVQFDPLLIYGILRRPRPTAIVPKNIKFHGISLLFKGHIVLPNDSNFNLQELRKEVKEECLDKNTNKNTNEKESHISGIVPDNCLIISPETLCLQDLKSSQNKTQNQSKECFMETEDSKQKNTQQHESDAQDLKTPSRNEKSSNIQVHSIDTKDSKHKNTQQHEDTQAIKFTCEVDISNKFKTDFHDTKGSKQKSFKEHENQYISHLKGKNETYQINNKHNLSNSKGACEKRNGLSKLSSNEALVRGTMSSKSELNNIINEINHKDNKASKSVRENPDETREVIIIYYLEDDSVEIKEKTSGYYVTIARRGKLYKRDSKVDSPEFYIWKELNVGIEISTFDLEIHLISCDHFTRRFFKDHDIPLNENEKEFNMELKNERVWNDSHYKVTLSGEEVGN